MSTQKKPVRVGSFSSRHISAGLLCLAGVDGEKSVFNNHRFTMLEEIEHLVVFGYRVGAEVLRDLRHILPDWTWEVQGLGRRTPISQPASRVYYYGDTKVVCDIYFEDIAGQTFVVRGVRKIDMGDIRFFTLNYKTGEWIKVTSSGVIELSREGEGFFVYKQTTKGVVEEIYTDGNFYLNSRPTPVLVMNNQGEGIVVLLPTGEYRWTRK